ncbi:hypothetical protein J132_05214 [Termitomyces sp. J132]|nr:hypothetical protein J132_05214 [Termitomyces sp. J132]
MEKERLARQKRLRPDIISTTTCNEDDDDDDEEDEELREPPVKRQQIFCSYGVRPANVSTINPLFWNGELRQTATQHGEPRKDGKKTFRLTEILGNKSELALAIISSYSLDLPWIYEFFDSSVPVIVVAQPDPSGETSLKYVFPNWIRTTPFLRGGRGCMHMKFMLLFYKTGRLRVVVSTANLIAYDYRDIENVVHIFLDFCRAELNSQQTIWLQDIPQRNEPLQNDSKALQDFPTVLQGVLHSLHVQPALRTMTKDNVSLLSHLKLGMRWDWSKVKVYLVPSISGKHEGWPAVVKTGHPRLMQAVRKMGLRTGKGRSSKDIALECQGSSIGVYTTQWFNEFHWSARGESAEDWLDEPRRRREKLPYPPISIIYPTKTTVQKTTLGEQGGGTLFCRRRQWAATKFPRDHFHDSRSKGGPVLMHSKVSKLQALKGQKTPDSDTEDDSDVEVIEPAVGWAYVGSHNFTSSAWGTLSGSGFNPVLNISNYELGIVFPLNSLEHADSVACFQRPVTKYTAGDVPWIQEESIYHRNE